MTNIRDSKTKNSSRNVVFGFALKVYQLLMPFIIRTIIIYTLGMEYAGLNSLFTSILSVLNIAELGVGTIMVFYMYKPIEEHDSERICALMNLYKLYYRVIGLAILGIGVAITPFIPKLIAGDVPADINIYILYYLNLGVTVLSYWLFAYKNSLFQAHQRNDVISKVTIITDTVKYILQISLLYLLHNYYYYVIVMLFIQILNNVMIAIRANKFFPNYKAKGYLSKAEKKTINSSIKDVFYGQLGMTVTLSVDSIVISAFLGLVPLARYQNYYYVVNALIGFFAIFYQSLRASIGTNIIVKTKDENFKDFTFINYVVFGVFTFCSCCLLNMFQPFIELWVGKANVLNYGYILLFVIYFLVYELSLLIGCYKDISGKWHADRFRPLITAVTNLVINIVLIQSIGLPGVLLSTILSFVMINIPWLYKRVFIDVFSKKYIMYYMKYLICKVSIVLFISLASVIICTLIRIDNLFIKLIFNFVISTVTSIGLYYFLTMHEESCKRVKQLVGRKLS